MTNAVQELFSLSQYGTLLLSSLTANHSKTKPLTDWSTGTVQWTSNLLSSSGFAAIWLGEDGSEERNKSSYAYILCLTNLLFFLAAVWNYNWSSQYKWSNVNPICSTNIHFHGSWLIYRIISSSLCACCFSNFPYQSTGIIWIVFAIMEPSLLITINSEEQCPYATGKRKTSKLRCIRVHRQVTNLGDKHRSLHIEWFWRRC